MYSQNPDPEDPPTGDQTKVRTRWGPRHTGMTPRYCCCCLPTEIGSLVAFIIWAGFSLYFAVLSFMDKSPFFSYMTYPALIVFGVLNLVFFFINVAAFIIFKWKAAPQLLSRAAQLIWVCSVLILVDMFCNFVVFLVKASDFKKWCLANGEKQVELAYLQSINSQPTANETLALDPNSDYYNCGRVYQDQTTWTLAALAAMIMVYVHWALVIGSWERWYLVQAPRIIHRNHGYPPAPGFSGSTGPGRNEEPPSQGFGAMTEQAYMDEQAARQDDTRATALPSPDMTYPPEMHDPQQQQQPQEGDFYQPPLHGMDEEYRMPAQGYDGYHGGYPGMDNAGHDFYPPTMGNEYTMPAAEDYGVDPASAYYQQQLAGQGLDSQPEQLYYQQDHRGHGPPHPSNNDYYHY